MNCDELIKYNMNLYELKIIKLDNMISNYTKLYEFSWVKYENVGVQKKKRMEKV